LSRIPLAQVRRRGDNHRMLRFFLVPALATVLAPALSVAQDPDRKTLVFPPGAKAPATAPNPAPASVDDSTSPAHTIDLFFLALTGDNVEAAYENLVKGTIIAERKEDVAALIARTREALDSYGPVRGFELIEERAVGKHLVRRTCLSLNSDLPLRWRFYFYLSGGRWGLVDLRVDDGLAELFEDSARKGGG
jgi:hypothetical protein